MAGSDPVAAELAAIRERAAIDNGIAWKQERLAADVLPRLVAAVEAALALGTEFNTEDGHYPDPGDPPVSRGDKIRAAISAALTGGGQ